MEITDLIEKYKNSLNKLILLDYDGTLVDYTPMPDEASPSGHLIEVLIKLADKPQTKVMIISGRGHQDIDQLLGRLPIDIIAEHGAMLKENGVWKKQVDDDCLWKVFVAPLLNKITLECPGSFVEEKQFSISWHYRNAEAASSRKHSRELIRKLQNRLDLKILDGNKVVEIMNMGIGKGKAVESLLKKNKYDFVLSIGDDKTDEEMFEFLQSSADAYTIKVGDGDTCAKYRLINSNEVLFLLKKL